MITYKIEKEEKLNKQEILKAFKEGLEGYELDGRKALVIIPDSTRSGPYHLLARLLIEVLKPIVKNIDFLIALGTHPIMTQKQIDEFLQISKKDKEGIFKDVNIFNHEWNKKSTFTKIGEFSEKEIKQLSDGLFKEKVSIEVNKLIFEYEVLIVLGPVFPHEIVGFSGGVKYLFPGISGREFIDFFHWFGAVLTNMKINGVMNTPVRKLIEKANLFVYVPQILIALDIVNCEPHGIYIGDIIDAWKEAAEAASKTHIVYSKKQYSQVLGLAPKFYDDIWTAGKVMYKLESIVKDGGELIIYAPHINEISYTHGKMIRKTGYHVKDYFLKQMNKFKDFSKGVLAHSTHVKGIGTYKNKKEKPRITVTLAAGIPEKTCQEINLNYRDYKKINIKEWENREDEGILVVPQAGETLFQYKKKL